MRHSLGGRTYIAGSESGMRLLRVTRLIPLVATLSRAASAQAAYDLDLPKITVEGHVEYRAETAPAGSPPGWLKTTVYVRATNAEGAKLQYGGCPFTVRMYASPARTGRPGWDALDVPNAVCTLQLTIARLGRGQEDTLSALTHPANVLGDSLAPGRYYVGAFVRPNGDSLVLDAGAVDLRP
jgi:hypothetical protein